MTNEKAVDWIDILIKEMKRDTSGPGADPEYKDEVYEALDKAKNALRIVELIENNFEGNKDYLAMDYNDWLEILSEFEE